MPIKRGDTSGPPVKRGLYGDTQGSGQGGGAAQDPDDTGVAHTWTLRRPGVRVKGHHAASALDSVSGGGFVAGMGKPQSIVTPEEMEWRKKCGQRLAWVREIAGYSQEELASFFDIGQQAISSYERGARALDPYFVLRFCVRFRASLDYVYRGKLEGVHPVLAKLLVAAHPELNQPTNRTETGMDTARAEYKAAIRES